MIKSKRNLLTVILSVLCAALLFCTVGLIGGTKNAEASTPTSGDIVIGEIAGNAGGSSANVKSLLSVLTNNDKTEEKTLNDVRDYFDLKARIINGTGCSVKALNEKDWDKNIYVTFGGIQWNIVFLTLNNDNDLILDLWQAEATIAASPMSDGGASANDTSLNNPSCIYGTSYMRCQVLGNGGDYYNYSNPSVPTKKASDPAVSEYYEFAKGKFSTFLDTPANIKYQETQNAPDTGMHSMNFPNDAWGVPSNESGWGGINYGPTGSNKEGYSDWKNDKIWLPSFSEIVGGNGIWGNAAARASADNTFARSGMHSWSAAPSGYYCFNTAGGNYGNGCSVSSEPHSVRPAVHVILKKLMCIADDVEVTYNGAEQTLKEVAADEKSWFDSNAMSLDYPDAPMINAGKYRVRVSLTQTAIDEGLEFIGEPDESKGESETVRFISFTIKPKPLSASLTESDGEVTLTIDEDGLCGADSPPNTAIRYKSADGGSYNSTTPPQQKGTFKAEPYITDASCNYALACEPASVTYTVNSIKVDLPALPPTAIPEYNGSAQTIAFTGYVHNGKGVNISAVTGKTAGGKNVSVAATFDTANGTVTFKDAGTYTVTFVLEDVANCVWKADGLNNKKNLVFTVKPKQLSVSASNDNGDLWSWGVGTACEATVTVSGIASGDSVKLTTVYTASTGTDVKSAGTPNGGAASVSDKMTLPANLLKGDYTLTAEIDNENYSLEDGLAGAGMPLTFTVGTVVFDPDSFAWVYSENNATGTQPIKDGDSILKYKLDASGKPYEYTLSINLGAYAGVFRMLTDTDYKNRRQTDAGAYTTTVKLTISNDNYSFDTTKTYSNATVISTTEAEVFINYTIEKGDFAGMETLPWVYRYGASGSWVDYNPSRPPEFGNGTVTVKMKGDVEGTLKGLTFNYGGVNSERNKGKYTVKMSFGVTDTDNFNIPAGFTFEWEISKKIINVQWEQDVAVIYDGGKYPEWKDNEYYATQLRYEKPEYADKVEYVYSCTLPDGTPYAGRGVEALAYITEKALEASRRIEVEVTVELKDSTVANDYELVDSTGGEFSTSFVVGDSKLTAKVALTASGEYGGFDYKLEVTGEDMDSGKYAVAIYRGTNLTDISDPANTLITDFDPKTADAGDYFVVVTLTGSWADEYRLSGAKKPFKILPKSVPVPTLSDVVFTGGELSILDYLGGSYKDWSDIITVGGEYDGVRNVKVGGYVATLTLINGNYRWDYGSGAAPAAYRTASEVVAQGSDTVASYNWNVTPLVIDTANMWNKGKNGATLNLPANVKSLIDAETLTVGYRYYDAASGEELPEAELKGGKQFKVEAVLGGFDAENGNVVFKKSETELGPVSKSIDYTVPQSGMNALAGKVKDMMTKTYMGLPLWLWLLIALAVLLFLIIIIVVACKKRKNKEEKAEKKAAKEEEKQRREEERRLKEEQREEEKRRREEEREAARAKQEAELELAKIKAQAAAAAAVPAVAATAAMSAQPRAQQQPMPQQMQQQMQQPYYPQQMQSMADSGVLARLEAEIAELRAENRSILAQQRQPQIPQYQPQMQAPAYGGQQSDMNAELRARLAEERARTAEDRLFRSAEQRALLAEDRLARSAGAQPVQPAPVIMQTPQPQPLQPATQQPVQTVFVPAQSSNNSGADAFGAVLASMFKSLNSGGAAKPEPEKVQPAAYPSDAVVTTTTTVDTTKAKPQRGSRDGNNNFDIDGFYEAFDGKQ